MERSRRSWGQCWVDLRVPRLDEPAVVFDVALRPLYDESIDKVPENLCCEGECLYACERFDVEEFRGGEAKKLGGSEDRRVSRTVRFCGDIADSPVCNTRLRREAHMWLAHS